VKYAFIQRHRRIWPIRVQCRVLGVSVSGFHQHLARRREIARRRHLSDEALLVHPRIICGQSRRLRMAAHLAATACSRHSRWQAAGATADAEARYSGSRQAALSRCHHRQQSRSSDCAECARSQVHCAAPNQAWVGDFTYIATEEGWLFLAVVIDLFSRKVVGWSMRPDMQRSLVIDALEMAWFKRNPGTQAGLIFHSDRGSQYASDDFSEVLKEHGITPSMSRKGNCWDNACSETLFASLKVERLHGQRFQTIREAKDETISWLLWYNRTRMHSTLNYVSPIEFEQDWTDAAVKIAA
jgi:putative transposase